MYVCMYVLVKLRLFRVTIFAAEKQAVLHIVNVCL